MKTNIKFINLFLSTTVILLLGLWFFMSQKNTGPIIDDDVGFVYTPPRELGEFQLIDFENNLIDENQFSGKWWLVYFGFTYCPDACPMALSDMAKIKSGFDEYTAEHTNFVFISVDPDRDTPQRLKEYVQFYDSNFYAATGEPGELQKLASKMGAAFIVPENPENENYIVGHSTFMLLLNPDTELVAVFRVPHIPKNVADSVMKIQQHYDPM